ncbi:MAG: [Fe-S]-binding protein [Paenibacillaceae bacterium]|jgi:O-6-methylguanine DNA methyltransferase|nr:MAG: [Fe-S]-binding protein [Paenibacillaceae bacterium]
MDMGQPILVRWIEIDSPVGPLVLLKADGRLCRVEFGRMEERRAALTAWAAEHGLAGDFRHAPDDPLLKEAAAQLAAYFRGERFRFELPTAMYGTPFQKAVWAALAAIPYGEVRSYKAVAGAIGRPSAVRAVGGANNRNPLPIIVPCHRVVGADGSLVGYAGGLDAKRRLLELERLAANVARPLANVL